MKRLTPLERMFVEEFCRFAGIEVGIIERLVVLERNRNPVGFVTTIDPGSVPPQLNFGTVFDTPRVAIVGPEHARCGSLLFFDGQTGALDAIEGYVYGDMWPEVETPAFWSEAERVAGMQGRQ